MTRFFFPATLLFTALGLFACARQGVLSGGPKDTTPPKVDSLRSSPNFSTRFQEKRIRLTFDEWVVLKDASSQVLISPPPVKRPEITLKEKTVTVKFAENEVLRPNTTYTINFSTAVQDLHEGNPAKDLRFVFSTGDFIDSLSLLGVVVDAFTGEPVENVSALLYENPEDSVAQKENPYYLARTDKNGLFTLQNIKPGRFKMLAFEDKDQNLKWSPDNEGIAFADTIWQINALTARRFSTLRLFKDQARFRVFDKNADRYGLIKITYTGPPNAVRLRTEPDIPGLRLLPVRNADTLLVWYDLPEPALWQLLAGNDTVYVRDLSRTDFFKTYRLGPLPEPGTPASAGGRPNRANSAATTPQGPKNISQNPDKRAFLDFITPIVTVDSAKWRLTTDSSLVAGLTVRPDSADPRRVQLALPWKAGKTYQLIVLPGAVTDFYGVPNADTIRTIYTVLSEKQLGGLNLTVTSLVPKSNYILQLISNNAVVEERRFQAELTEKRLVFTNLLTALYTIQLIEDRNGNGKWDTGDYYAHRQPERIFTKKLDALRANWEVEATMEATAGTGRKQPVKGKTN